VLVSTLGPCYSFTMTIGSIIGAIIIGLSSVVLGQLFAPGKQNIPIW
jgi:hypothetical protein